MELGMTYRDVITGFKGVLVGEVTYLTGCNQGLLAPKVGGDGARVESQWFDTQRLQLIINVPKVELNNEKTPGSDRAAPKR